MGSMFVVNDINVKQSKKRNPFKSPPQPLMPFMQFVPALVIDVVTGPGSLSFTSMRDINAIVARPHYEDAFGEDEPTDASVNRKYFPLLRGVVDTPNKGDMVLVCTFGGEDFYFGPINTINSPCWNPDHLNTPTQNISNTTTTKNQSIQDKYGLSKNFKYVPIPRLTKLYNDDLDGTQKAINDISGDFLLEGRYGNSIRLGSRDINPCIVISNGRSLNIAENLSDSSLMSFTDKGSITQHFPGYEDIELEETVIGFTLASDSVKNNKRKIGGDLYNYDYSDGQIFQSSERITINSKKDSLFLSSFQNTIIGSGNSVRIHSNNETIIESSNIYLGKQAQEAKEPEPIILGNKLTDILNELMSILETFKVTGTLAGISSLPSPDVIAKITQLKSKISSLQHLSDYHYIEDNGQKP
tara:strand:+ start:119 stop:1357 length:1239 start_codon:yes stop_codon:yes gene_type:complete